MTKNQKANVSAHVPGADESTSGVGAEAIRAGARTPDELETLFEDTLLIRDGEALAMLFEDGALLDAGVKLSARGGRDIARLTLATLEGELTYIADPLRVAQTRDVALIVAGRAINVVRRGHDGAWRYAIVLLIGDHARGKEQS